MYDNTGRPRYLLPGLAGIYRSLKTYSWPLVRVTTGLLFVPHGMQKLFGLWGGNIANTAEGFAKQGLEPALALAYYIGGLEFLGGILLAIGFLTRPVALLFAGFMAVAAFHVHIKIGWFWNQRGMEMPLLLMLLCVAILIRGGGPFSVDRALNREI